MSRRPWTFITNHGAVLALISQSESITARAIAARLGVTERTVMRIIKDLEMAGYVRKFKKGRMNHYLVNRELPLRRNDKRDVSLAKLLDLLDESN